MNRLTNWIENHINIFIAILFIFGLFFIVLDLRTEKNIEISHLAFFFAYVVFNLILALSVKHFSAGLILSGKNYKNLLEELKEANIELKANKEERQDLIESMPLCVKIFDKDRHLIFLNRGGREEHFLENASDEKIKKWDWLGTVKKEYQEQAIEKFKNAFEKGEIGVMDFEHTPEGSKYGWCSSLFAPLKDKNGDIKSVLFLSNDITALKHAELKARKNAEMFQFFIDEIPLCIKWFDKDGKLISINKEGRREHFLENKTEDEIKQWDYLVSVDNSYKSIVKDKFLSALRGESSSFEFKHINSRSQWCYSTISPIKDNNKGDIIYVLFISRDITQEKLIDEKIKENFKKEEEVKSALFNILEDIKESEKIIEEERNRSQAIISSMGEGLLVINKAYNIISINKQAENLLGFVSNDADIINNNIYNLFKFFKKDEEIISDDNPIDKMFKTGESVTIRIEDDIYLKTSSKKFPAEIIVSPLRGDGIIAAVVLFNDISKEKLLDESKTNFISVASHQLRTPLTAIRWYTEMLQSGDAGPLNENQKNFSDQIYGGVLRLNETLNILLYLARIENKQIKIMSAKIDLFVFTQKLLKDFTPQISKKKINVSIDLDSQKIGKLEAMVDESLLTQAVGNLVSNAINYTKENGIVKIKIERQKENILYSVEDNGIGIPEAQKDKIFSKFFRADNAMITVPDGNGLGLALVKNLVEFWKGKIWFESQEGKGAKFYFTIPI